MDEIKLVEKAKNGHTMSLNFLLEENYIPLYAFLVKMIGNQELAKDITQDAMVKAVTNIKKFRGDSKFSSWLIRIGINTYKNYVKKNKVNTELLDYNTVSNHNVEDEMLKKSQWNKVVEKLKDVKEPDRTIFILKYYEGYGYQEIAYITGVKIGTCKSKMHYLINKLRQELEGS